MSNKQGQPTRTGNEEGQGNQAHQEETKRRQQGEAGGDPAQHQGQGSDAQKKGTQRGSQNDKHGKLG
jgi:hypothetical protein